MTHSIQASSPVSTSSRPNAAPEALNRLTAIQLDRLLTQYAQRGDAFTVCELRDQLLKEPELEQACPKTLRMRVRDRIKALYNQGLAHQVGIQGKRQPVFKLDLCEAHVAATPEPPQTPPLSSSETSRLPAHVTESSEFLVFLRRERRRIKLEMKSALGEAHHYHQILSQFPEQRDRIAPHHHAALMRGSELKGALDAVIRLSRCINEKVAS